MFSKRENSASGSTGLSLKNSYIDSRWKMIRDIEKKLIVQKRLQQEYAQLITVTDEELRAWYEKNKERFSEDGNIKSFEESVEQVYAAVHLEKEMQVQSQLIRKLIDKYDVVIHLSRSEKSEE